MGPCLCGDPYCGSCGNPSAPIVEEAEQWCIDTLGKARLSAEEYRIVASVGLAAVHHARAANKRGYAAAAEWFDQSFGE